MAASVRAIRSAEWPSSASTKACNKGALAIVIGWLFRDHYATVLQKASSRSLRATEPSHTHACTFKTPSRLVPAGRALLFCFPQLKKE